MRNLLSRAIFFVTTNIVCLTLYNVPLFSQNENLKFERLSLLDGLSQNTVTSIIQDRQGFMWFATMDGLNKYDGYNFTVYKHIPVNPNSLSSNSLWALYQDKQGFIWVATVSAGLDRLDPRTETITHFSSDSLNPNSLSGNRIRALCEDDAGFLWVGTRDNGLNRYDPDTGTFTRYKHDPEKPTSISDNHIRSLMADKNGKLWIGTTYGGLNLFDPDLESFSHFTFDAADPRSLSSNNVEAIEKDSEGILWVGTYGGGLNRLILDSQGQAGFVHYRHDVQNPSSLSDDVIQTIYTDSAGELWIGTISGGLCRFDRESEDFVCYQHQLDDPESISFNNIQSVFEDASRNLWIGTWGGGLSKLDRKATKFVHYSNKPNDPNSLCHNYVRAIWQGPSGELWIGTSGGGLDRIDRQKNKFVHYMHDPSDPNSISSNDVRSVSQDRNGALWIGTYGDGLNRFIPPTGLSAWKAEPSRFIHFKHDPGNLNSLSNDYVWTVYVDRSGILWLGTNDGLNRFDPGAQIFTHYKHEKNNPNSLINNIVRAIYEDKTGNLWLGTYGGLSMLSPATQEFKNYSHRKDDPGSLSSSAVMSIFESDSGALWLGTLGGGLNKLDIRQEKFTHYLESDGLPNTFVHTILGDGGGNLWLATNKGLSRFSEAMPNGEKFRNFDVHDGLQSNEFNVGSAFRSRNGELFFGGINGFNSFFPDKLENNPYAPLIAITDFEIFNVPAALNGAISHTKEIELSHEDRFFSFEFAALDYTFPRKNQYAYKMEGFDSDWIYSGSRRYAGYTNLDPGEYIFRVKGSNNDGLWNEEGASVRIKIMPAFWQTWWFRVLALLITCSLLGFIYRRRVAQLRRAKKTQEDFSRRLIEIQETERQRIASELHDGLGQELLVINQGLQQAAGTLPADSATKRDLEQISETALDAINDVREISSNLHPHQLDRLGLRKAIEAMARRLAQSSNISVNLEIKDLPGFFDKNEEINVYRIVQEGLNNVLKHSAAGSVLIQFTRSRRAVNLLIQDDGRGFHPNVSYADSGSIQGFGLANIAERAKMLNGKFVIVASPGHGTTLKIEIPTQAGNRISK